MILVMDRSIKLKMRVNKKSKCIISNQKGNYF